MSGLMAFGAGLSADEVERLQQSVKIGSVNSDTIRGDDDTKSEQIKFFTYQDENDDALNFQMRITAELTDKSKKTYFAQITRGQGELHEDYTGEDNWRFQVPHGDLNRPKLTAYVIQYGVLCEGEFVPLAEAFDGADSADEITARSTTRVDIKSTWHTYSYRDGDEVLQSLSN
ncbi:MAG: hypothetical protein JEZ10_01890 [Verrucomicrobia bacterium]|nr:hypothetical protein [Verrucomicrobiota bacterium]